MEGALRRTRARVIGVGAIESEDRYTAVAPPEHSGDRFEIGSITKVVTGIVLARLVLDGRATLDAPVSNWLDAGDHGGVTLEQLATHTSGLPRLAPNHGEHEGYDPTNLYAAYTAELAEAGLRAAERNDIGSYAYSNFGYQLLGLCIERLANKSLAELFAEFVFEPSGMTQATADPSLPVLQGEDDDGAVANWTLILQGPGGINGTIDDLLSLVGAVLAPPDERLGQALAFALEPRAKGPGAQVGLGWLIHPAGIACCGGATAGFSTYVAAHLQESRGVAVALNRHIGEMAQNVALAAVQGQDPGLVVPAPFEGDPAPWRERALQLFNALAAEDFEAARALMRSDTAASLTLERLSGAWGNVSSACGALGEPEVADIARARGAVQVTAVAPGSAKPLTLRAWLDEEKRVVGVTIQ